MSSQTMNEMLEHRTDWMNGGAGDGQYDSLQECA